MEIVAAPDFPAYDVLDNKSHEAGYDAFMTGLCFISMSNFLGNSLVNFYFSHLYVLVVLICANFLLKMVPGKLSESPLGTVLPDSAFILPFIQK